MKLNLHPSHYFTHLVVFALGLAMVVPSLLNGTVVLGDNLGFVSGISPLFLVGFSVIMLATLSMLREGEIGFASASVAILVLLKNLSEIVVGRTGFAPWAMPNVPNELGIYGFNGYTAYVLEHGFVNPHLFVQGNWPGSWALFSSFFSLTGLSPLSTIGPVTIGVSVFLPLLLYVLLVSLLRTSQTYGHFNVGVAVLFFFLVTWDFPFGLQPNSVGYVLFLVALLILAKASERRTGSLTLAFIVVILALGVVHLLSSLVVICITCFLVASKRVPPSYLFAGISAVIGWQLFGSIGFVSGVAANLVQYVGPWNLINIFSSSIGQRIVGQPIHLIVDYVRIFLPLSAGAIALVSWANSRPRPRHRLTFADSSILGVILLFILLGDAYLFESLNRLLLYVMPAFVILVARLPQKRTVQVALTLFLLSAVPLSFIATYGNQSSDYVTPATMTSLHYMENRGVNGSVLGATTFGVFLDSASTQFGYYLINALTEAQVLNGSFGGPKPAIMAVSSYDSGRNSIAGLTTNSSYVDFGNNLANSARWQLIYSSEGVAFFVTV